MRLQETAENKMNAQCLYMKRPDVTTMEREGSKPMEGSEIERKAERPYSLYTAKLSENETDTSCNILLITCPRLQDTPI